MEKGVLDFWKKEKIFEKSVESKPEDKIYSFYDGPPFITGVPHYGNLLSSIVKDCIPRYWTMRGFRVDRRWGWDCHGLPAENMVEKKLGIKSKKEIEEVVGIDKFNQACFAETSKIADEWENIVDRIGRWVEFKGAYKTMDNDYMESVWWAFSELDKKGLIYEDVRVSLYCPRCATPLSNFEIAMDNSYQEDKDPSVFVKFKVIDEKDTYFLVWTTTPWTLPANVALAANSDISYMKVTVDKIDGELERMNIKEGESYVFADETGIQSNIFGDRIHISKDYRTADSKIKTGDGQETHVTFKDIEVDYKIIGKKYKPLFLQEQQKDFKVIDGKFVTVEDGTGIVHIAPAFGEDDFQARKEYDLPIILNVNEEGKFSGGEWEGEFVWEANFKIIKWLKEKNFLFFKRNITHSYPHCHRCGTKLIYKAQPAWFVNIAKIKQELIDNNKNINWYPEYLKEGRFGKGLESAPDWNISRDRYWGTAIPVWKCEDKNCGEVKVIGSYVELEKLSGKKIENYHRPEIDEVSFKCEKCGKEMKRIPQVFDCWVESGSMSFAQFHYPFENKEQFEKSFPTNFISEYIAQTRAWFYVMHVMAVGVFGKEAYKNVLATGTIAGEDGRKMSKSLGNYTDPNIVLEKYSADALRFYLLSSPLLNAQNLNFSEEAVGDIQRRVLGTLWNSYSFFVLYANVDKWQPQEIKMEEILNKGNILDKWLLSELNQLIQEINEGFESYSIIKPAKKIEKFVDNLSNWYIRRSRRRFWKSEGDDDKNLAYQTLWLVLTEFSKAIAPYCPFIAEEIFKNLTGKESVHLENFPKADQKLIDVSIINQMDLTREIVNQGLSIRAKNQIKVRQPLERVLICSDEKIDDELMVIIKEELNVKRVEFFDRNKQKNLFDKVLVEDLMSDKKELVYLQDDNKDFGSVDERKALVVLDANIDKNNLRAEGEMRDLIRQLQQARKEADFEIDDRIIMYYEKNSLLEKFKEEIKKEVLIKELLLVEEEPNEFDYKKEVKVNQAMFKIWLKN